MLKDGVLSGLNHEPVSLDMSTEAVKEVIEFATQTWRALCKIETDMPSRRTDCVKACCRLDISVCTNDKGNLEYFVNETAKGPTMCTGWSSSMSGDSDELRSQTFLVSGWGEILISFLRTHDRS